MLLLLQKMLYREISMENGYEKRGYLLDAFRLFHLKDSNGTKVNYHYHEFYKLLFLRSGSGGYSVEGQRYTLEAGDVVLIGIVPNLNPVYYMNVSLFIFLPNF